MRKQIRNLENRVGTNAEFFIFKLALFYSAANKRTHTQRNGRANMQYKFRLGRWTDGRNVRIIHPSLFSAIPLLPPIIYSKIRMETHGMWAEIDEGGEGTGDDVEPERLGDSR